MDSRFLAFLGISILLIITPGPDMATVTKNALSGGRRGVLLTTFGIGSAILVHVSVATLGLSALLRAASGLYAIVKLLGAAYLLFLGTQTLWSTRSTPSDAAVPLRRALWGSPYQQGFVSALLNPKLVIFFATFLPQFLVPGQPVLPRMLLLGVLFDALGVAWLTGYGLLVARVRTFFASPRVHRWMERLTGTVLVGLGARLALERL